MMGGDDRAPTPYDAGALRPGSVSDRQAAADGTNVAEAGGLKGGEVQVAVVEVHGPREARIAGVGSSRPVGFVMRGPKRWVDTRAAAPTAVALRGITHWNMWGARRR
jgi:hypothetical protein